MYFVLIFHTQIYQKMQILAGEKARKLKSEMTALEHKMEEAADWLKCEESLDSLLKQKDFSKIIKLVKTKQRDMLQQEKDVEKKLEKAERDLKETEVFCSDIQKCSMKIQQTEQELQKLSLEKQKSKKKIQQMQQKKAELENKFDEIQEMKEKKLFLDDARQKAMDGRKLQEEKNQAEMQLIRQKQRCAAARHQKWEICAKRQKEAEIQLKNAKSNLNNGQPIIRKQIIN